MADLPKISQRTREQKALGYLNAAREALSRTLFNLGNDHPAHEHVKDMIQQTYDIEEVFSD